MTYPYETPPHLASQDAECIAWELTDDSRQRWVELSVWFLHDPKMGGKPWVTRSVGHTRVAGERTRVSELAAGTLERSLKLIDERGDIGVVVAERAREWAGEHPVAVQNARSGPVSFDSDREALAWLYGQPEFFNGFPALLERDLGAGRSTARMQLADGRPVMVPLRAVLPFVDRDAFRRAAAGLGES